MPIGHGQAFKVEANREVCYEGVYVSAASSSRPWRNCAIILDKDTGLPPDRWDSAQRIHLSDFFEGTDPRGDERIHEALASLGNYYWVNKKFSEAKSCWSDFLVKFGSRPGFENLSETIKEKFDLLD